MILKLKKYENLKGPEIWKDKTPKWSSFSHPSLELAIKGLAAKGVRFTEIYRPPDISLSAMKEKRGVQPPGYSAHNFGFAVDVDIEGTLKDTKMTYKELYALMESEGFYCHRRDINSGAMEAWHFNYLKGNEDLLSLATSKSVTWSQPVEALIIRVYGPELKLTPAEAQKELQEMKLYSGEVDGQWGPMSKRALEQFQKTWNLVATGVLDEKTQRVLALVGATKEIS